MCKVRYELFIEAFAFLFPPTKCDSSRINFYLKLYCIGIEYRFSFSLFWFFAFILLY